tara:strand:+ start:145 stop:600 length:456 start_codon:yes stop_codon:yes gene_type:complete
LERSFSSFNFADIKGFVYGPYTSRFWMLRKHILLMNIKKLKENPPFNAWDCITLQIEGRPDIYLLIKNEEAMKMFIKLLIYKLDTIDGNRGTAVPIREQILKKELKNTHVTEDMRQKAVKKIKCHILNRVSLNYTLLKIKQKLSFSAFIRN